MQSWIKTLLRSGKLEELPEELTKLLAQAERDRKALSDLLKRSEAASKKIEGLADPLDALTTTAETLSSQMSQLKAKVEGLEGAASKIETTAAQAAVLAESQAVHVAASAKNGRRHQRFDGQGQGASSHRAGHG